MTKFLMTIPILFLGLSVLSSDASLPSEQGNLQIYSSHMYQVTNCPTLENFSVSIDSAYKNLPDADRPIDSSAIRQDAYEVLWNQYASLYCPEDGPKLTKKDFIEKIDFVKIHK